MATPDDNAVMFRAGGSGLPPWRESVTVAYLDEPPFGIPARPPARPTGCDMELADHVLTAAGSARIHYTLTTFPELIPGLLNGRWHMTTALFVTDDRATAIDYTRPIWAAVDGFIVRRDDAPRFTGYEAIADTAGAILAVVSDQVQHQTARDAGVPPERITEFPDQDAAAAAVRDGRVHASASTAIGNQAYVKRADDPALTAVADQRWSQRRPLPLGAFAINKRTPDLTAAVDRVLDRYLGSADHLALMERYGFSRNDLATILPS
jgi:polar amino acid transport system substrate-binding protein